ncbi:hypothetical protein D3C72_2158690 [compost metagenome]
MGTLGNVALHRAFADQVHQAGHESRMRARRGNAGGLDAQVLARFQGLGVEVPGNFHVVADKAEGNDDHAAHAFGGDFLEVVVDVRFKPRDVRGTGA